MDTTGKTINQKSELPLLDAEIACSLTSEELSVRKNELRELLADDLIGVDKIESGTTLWFRSSDALRRRIESAIEKEKQCCPFLHFEIAGESPRLRLTITGPAGAEEIIEGLATLTPHSF